MARVLVVDDDPDLLALVEIHLLQHGHLVAKATSGSEALDVIAERGTPDIAVLDVSMRGMKAFDLLKELRTRDGLQTLPAIFLSAQTDPADVEVGRAPHAVYLTKPDVTSALLGTIDQLLAASSDA